MDNIIFRALKMPNYDDTVKVGKRTLKCYSEKQMDKLYPDGEYNIVGEVLKGNSKNQVAVLTTFESDETGLPVSSFRTYSRVFYKNAGYVAVDDIKDRYIALLTLRKGFLLFLILAAIGIIASVSIIISTVLHPQSGPTGNDYIVPMPESNAQEYDDGNTDKADSESGGGSVSMTYSRAVKINIQEQALSFFFANPYSSNHNVVLEIMATSEDRDVLIAESGLLQPGYSLSILALKDTVDVEKGTYKGYFNVIYLDPVTGEKALVKANIPITITAE